jgi:hypothetical protein
LAAEYAKKSSVNGRVDGGVVEGILSELVDEVGGNATLKASISNAVLVDTGVVLKSGCEVPSEEARCVRDRSPTDRHEPMAAGS